MAEELNLDIFIEEREVSLSMEPKINDLNSQKKKKKINDLSCFKKSELLLFSNWPGDV